MKTESKIRGILKNTTGIDNKVSSITKFMHWDEKKLKTAIEKHGTSSQIAISEIIEEFWGKKG